MDQLIFLVVVGALAFGKWLIENAGKSRDGEPNDLPEQPQSNRPARSGVPPLPRSNPGPLPSGETDEEKMRRFMEALGLPRESMPPPVRKPAAPPAMKRPETASRPPLRPDIRHVGHPVSPPPAPSRRPKIAPPLETVGPLPSIPKTASVGETAPSMEVTSIPQMTFGEPAQAIQSAVKEVYAPAIQPGTVSAPAKRQEPGVQATLREQLRTPASLRNAILLREILGSPKGLQSAQTPSIFSPL